MDKKIFFAESGWGGGGWSGEGEGWKDGGSRED